MYFCNSNHSTGQSYIWFSQLKHWVSLYLNLMTYSALLSFLKEGISVVGPLHDLSRILCHLPFHFIFAPHFSLRHHHSFQSYCHWILMYQVHVHLTVCNRKHNWQGVLVRNLGDGHFRTVSVLFPKIQILLVFHYHFSYPLSFGLLPHSCKNVAQMLAVMSTFWVERGRKRQVTRWNVYILER